MTEDTIAKFTNIDSNLTVSYYMATVICDEKTPQNLRELRLQTLRRLQGQLNSYKEKGFHSRITIEIAKKKGAMILVAKTKSEFATIISPPTPSFDGNDFHAAPTLTAEEELIAWSEASLRAPLNSAGYYRYEKLFRIVFPDESKEIFHN